MVDACKYGYGEILSSEPHADRVLINQLRVAEWLKRSFNRAERIKHHKEVCNIRSKKGGDDKAKPCSVSLELATLSTKFQLVGDASGGLLDLAKVIPVVATPTLQINADYFHQITIIFSGNNAVAESSKIRDDDGRARIRDRSDRYDRYDARPARQTPKYEPWDTSPKAEEWRRSPEGQEWLRQENERRERLRLRTLDRLIDKLDAMTSRDTEKESDSVARQLRAIRDATILNAPR